MSEVEPNLRVISLTGSEIAAVLEPLAALRIRVFRDFPYLYDGDPAYEARYLRRFAEAPEALMVAALAGEQLVGASTALPLIHEHDDFKRPFERHGIEPRTVFYLAESVLLPAYRGQRIGHEFFDRREAAGQRLGHALTAFCAVVRSANDPRRPSGYRPLDGFWRGRGYRPIEGMTTTFRWKQLGETRETAQPMQFWLREFAGS